MTSSCNLGGHLSCGNCARLGRVEYNSIRQVIDANGNVLDAITYDPFGNIISQTNASNAPRFLYAGGAIDSLTGNYQFDTRAYNPGDGRFVTEDWAAFSGGDADLYRYVLNDPVKFDDPTGLRQAAPFMVPGLLMVPPGGWPDPRNQPSKSWSFYKWLYTGSGYTPDAVYEKAMAEGGEYLYQHSPFRGVYGFAGVEGKHVEALGLVGYDMGNGGWAGGLVATPYPPGMIEHPGLSVGWEWTTQESTPIALVDPGADFPLGAGMFFAKDDFGVYGSWHLGHFGVWGVGAYFSYENFPNYLNGDYWSGRLPLKE